MAFCLYFIEYLIKKKGQGSVTIISNAAYTKHQYGAYFMSLERSVDILN